MKSTLVHKHEIAVEFIEEAICLFDKGKYFSALHLAGAAEEIFHDSLKDQGTEPTKEKNSRLAKKLGDVLYGDGQSSKKSLEKAMDYSKNAVKHLKNKEDYLYNVHLRPNIDAFRMIRRAIKNARLSHIALGQTVNSFMSLNERNLHNT